MTCSAQRVPQGSSSLPGRLCSSTGCSENCVKTSKPIRGLHVIVGRLNQFDGEQIVVTDPKMKKDSDYVIPMEDIKETRLEVEI